MNRLTLLVAAGFAVAGGISMAQDGEMSFFLTSAGPGNGADLGGLDGADAHCQALAQTAGSGGKTWRAYLSTDAVNARDRIGSGPWHNAARVLIAENVDDLHSDNANIDKETALDENGTYWFVPAATTPRISSNASAVARWYANANEQETPASAASRSPPSPGPDA